MKKISIIKHRQGSSNLTHLVNFDGVTCGGIKKDTNGYHFESWGSPTAKIFKESGKISGRTLHEIRKNLDKIVNES